MPKRRKKPGIPAALMILGLIALLLFAAGEAWVMFHSETGQVRLARWMPGNRRANVGRVLAEQIRRGLTAAEVPPDSVHESGAGDAVKPAAWRVGLRPDQSLLQTNYAITHYVEEKGGQVLSAREWSPERGVVQVRMSIGLPKLPTQDVVLSRGARDEHPVPGSARLALVLFGFSTDLDEVKPFLALPAPFAVALTAGAPKSGQLFRAAHAASRELVVALPLEPVNYPQVNPGPGTLLVTMSPAQITGLTRRYLDQASPLVAVTNHMGSLATQDGAAMGAVFQELQRRHAPFVQLLPVPGSVCRSVAGGSGVVYSEPGAVLDAEARGSKEKSLDQRWDDVLQHARDRGRMTVWIRATPLVQAWLPKAVAAKRLGGVDLVPLSVMLRKGANL